MGSERKSRRRSLRRVAAGVLVAGLAAAAVVFVTAPAEVEDDYPGAEVASIANSKRYQRELERIGGKAAIAAAEFNDWFDSLWRGRKLAGTLATLSVGISLLCFLASNLPPFDD